MSACHLGVFGMFLSVCCVFMACTHKQPKHSSRSGVAPINATRLRLYFSYAPSGGPTPESTTVIRGTLPFRVPIGYYAVLVHGMWACNAALVWLFSNTPCTRAPPCAHTGCQVANMDCDVRDKDNRNVCSLREKCLGNDVDAFLWAVNRFHGQDNLLKHCSNMQ